MLCKIHWILKFHENHHTALTTKILSLLTCTLELLLLGYSFFSRKIPKIMARPWYSSTSSSLQTILVSDHPSPNLLVTPCRLPLESQGLPTSSSDVGRSPGLLLVQEQGGHLAGHCNKFANKKEFIVLNLAVGCNKFVILIGYFEI